MLELPLEELPLDPEFVGVEEPPLDEGLAAVLSHQNNVSRAFTVSYPSLLVLKYCCCRSPAGTAIVAKPDPDTFISLFTYQLKLES